LKISEEQIKAAYPVAKRVYAGEISRAAGTRELVRDHGLNSSSAADTISNVRYLLRGERYARTMNKFATDYFLQMIHRDFGSEVLDTAVGAVEKHVAYYESLRPGTTKAIQAIAKKYRAIVGGTRQSERELEEDLKGIKQQANVDATTKRLLVDARLGQGKFRTAVLDAWGNCCAVTGSRVRAAIRASHVKPWRESTNVERLDSNNGLPLVASLDALFDAGLISFDSSGKLLASGELNSVERSIFGIRKGALKKRPVAKMAEYLAHHRQKYGFA
jgi:predicted restriction endonuclease